MSNDNEEVKMASKEMNIMFKIWRTVHEMLQDRGYVVSNKDLNMTFKEFEKENKNKTREELIILTEKRDDRSDQIFVFFPKDEKLGIPAIRDCCTQMQMENVDRAIIVVKDSVTAFAKQAMKKISSQFKLEQFNQGELMINITKHKLVPKHILLTDEEKKQLLDKYKLKESQLPKIQKSDPIARYFGLERDQVVKIVRPSETAGRYVTYRLVI